MKADGKAHHFRTISSTDGLLRENHRMLKEQADLISANTRALERNNALLESINEYLHKIAINTS